MASTNPVVVVHGIQGSWLKDEYPVDYQDSVLWTGILKKKFGALHLHELDASVDAVPTRLVYPHQAVPLIYESLVDEIREELEDDHPYVYMFTYDWRKDNRVAAAELGRFVERVLHIAGVHERKKAARAPKKVNLIGHSMGGFVCMSAAARLRSSTISSTVGATTGPSAFDASHVARRSATSSDSRSTSRISFSVSDRPPTSGRYRA